MGSQINLFALVMLMTGAVDSIRNLPATALFGTTLIFFLVLSAIFFLLPTALVSAELSAALPEKSGVYSWVRLALGEKIGFLAIWLQWINTMVWYPTILSFIAGTLSYLIDPALAQNKAYLLTVILCVFWAMTFINLRGLKLSAMFAMICTVIGFVLPVIFIIALAVVWVIAGNPLQLHFTAHNLIPHMGETNSWISLTAIMTSFLGMELSSVHVNKMKNPQSNFPKALLISTILILITMGFGALAIGVVLPADQISLVSGVMQAFNDFLSAYHLSWALPIVTVMLIVGSLGGMINWIISPAKGLLQAADHGFLPAFFAKENRHGVCANVLILQAVLVTLMCLAFLLMPSVNGSYWYLTSLSTQLYMLMYVLMFVSAFILKFKLQKMPGVFKIPGGVSGMGIVSIMGIIGCVVTLCVGFLPPTGMNVGGALHYVLSFVVGMIIMIVPVFFFYGYRHFFHS